VDYMCSSMSAIVVSNCHPEEPRVFPCDGEAEETVWIGLGVNQLTDPTFLSRVFS
jgi:hypothetical protein